MEYCRISRFELSQIADAYERFRQSPENQERREYVEQQLGRIGLTINTSRFDLAQRIRDIESKL